MERWRGRVALVTGASAGIGAALVKELVKCGMKVCACARNVDKIKELKESLSGEPGQVYPLQCDVRDERAVRRMFADVRVKYGTLHLLINNAGMARSSSLLDGETKDWMEMFETNVLGPCVCTTEAYKLMDEGGKRDCQIINISSMGGHRLVKTDAHFYGMTKAALNAHTEGVRRELRENRRDYNISQISPGRVDTEFHIRKFGAEAAHAAARDLTPNGQILSAEDVVDACIYILSTAPHVQVHDIMIRPTQQIP